MQIAMDYVNKYFKERVLVKDAEFVLKAFNLDPGIQYKGRAAIEKFKELHTEWLGDKSKHFVNTSNPENYQHILVIMEELSKFVLLEPIRNESIQEIRRVLHDQVISLWGPPTYLLTDEHKSFTGDELQRLRQGLGIQHLQTIPRQPTGNASNERAHGIIINSLRTMLEAAKDQWPQALKSIQYAMNTFRSKDLPFSPYQIIYGKQPQNDYITQIQIQKDYQPEVMDDVSYDELQEFQKQLQIQRNLLAQIHKDLKQSQVDRANANRIKQIYKKGDLVLVIDEWERQNKLLKELHGPFTVIRKINDEHYVIRTTKAEKIYNTFRLRRYYPREETNIIQSILSTTGNSPDVNKTLSHRQEQCLSRSSKKFLPIIKQGIGNTGFDVEKILQPLYLQLN